MNARDYLFRYVLLTARGLSSDLVELGVARQLKEEGEQV